MSSNWRTEVDAEDYFGHQKKKLDLADRRPLIRRASDLVGPGIAPHATPFTDFNDPLLTFNGFFSNRSFPVNGPPGGGLFFGFVVSDAVVGGYQHFTNWLVGNTPWVRQFTRNASNPDQIQWGPWESTRDDRPSMVRKSPTADDSNTSLSTTSWTNLTLPTRLHSGLGSTFDAPNTHSIRLLRPGLYTGSVTISLYGSPSRLRVHGPAGTTPSTVINTRTIQTGDTESVTFALDVAPGGLPGTVQFSGQVNTGTSAAVALISDFWVTRIGPR